MTVIYKCHQRDKTEFDIENCKALLHQLFHYFINPDTFDPKGKKGN